MERLNLHYCCRSVSCCRNEQKMLGRTTAAYAPVQTLPLRGNLFWGGFSDPQLLIPGDFAIIRHKIAIIEQKYKKRVERLNPQTCCRVVLKHDSTIKVVLSDFGCLRCQSRRFHLGGTNSVRSRHSGGSRNRSDPCCGLPNPLSIS